MTALLWWRSWHGAPTDNKWLVIAARSNVNAGMVSAIAWALMDYASQNKDRGSVIGFDTEVYSAFSGFEEAEINRVIKSMTDKEMIINGRFVNWEKRQPKREDDSTPRVTKFRELKRNVTQSNAEKNSVTLDSVSVNLNLLNESLSLNGLNESLKKSFGEFDSMIEEEANKTLEWSDKTFAQIGKIDYVKIWSLVTGQAMFPGSRSSEIMTSMDALSEKYVTPGAMVDYLKPYFLQWINTRGKSGQRYKASNPAWLIDFAVTGVMPGADEKEFSF